MDDRCANTSKDGCNPLRMCLCTKHVGAELGVDFTTTLPLLEPALEVFVAQFLLFDPSWRKNNVILQPLKWNIVQNWLVFSVLIVYSTRTGLVTLPRLR